VLCCSALEKRAGVAENCGPGGAVGPPLRPGNLRVLYR